VAGVNLPDLIGGSRSHNGKSRKWLMKVDTIKISGLAHCFKESFAISEGRRKEGDGVMLIDPISPFTHPLNDFEVRLMVGKRACQDMNIMAPGRQPGRLFIKNTLRTANDIVNRNIGNKKDSQRR
jgi:hypothetical protein